MVEMVAYAVFAVSIPTSGSSRSSSVTSCIFGVASTARRVARRILTLASAERVVIVVDDGFDVLEWKTNCVLSRLEDDRTCESRGAAW